MTEDRSLEEYIGGDSPAEDADSSPNDGGSSRDAASLSDDGDSTASDGSDTGVDETRTTDDEATDDAATPDETEGRNADDGTERRDDDASPTVGTYRWDPAGVDCPDCGEAVDRLWLDDGEQVCADCKAW